VGADENDVRAAVFARLAAEIRARCDDLQNLEEVAGFVASAIPGVCSADEIVAAVWNNTPGRTHGEVLAVIDAAIARQRAVVGGPK
jgi:hypothetical protein